VKILLLAQRLTHISAVATVLLITETFKDKERYGQVGELSGQGKQLTVCVNG